MATRPVALPPSSPYNSNPSPNPNNSWNSIPFPSTRSPSSRLSIPPQPITCFSTQTQTHYHAKRPRSTIPVCFAKPSQTHFDDLTSDRPSGLDDRFFEDEMLQEQGYEDEDDGDEDGDKDAENSVDLFIRFLQSMFKKVAKRAKKASRSVLPPAIPPKLVSFAVDGVLLLASLSIMKALLQVACSLGGTVFVVILLLRVIWATVAYFQSNGSGWNQGGSAFGSTQPVL